MAKVTLKFTKEKETPGTVRFAEDGDKDNHKVGTLYVKKSAGDLADKDTLTVTIEAK